MMVTFFFPSLASDVLRKRSADDLDGKKYRRRGQLKNSVR